MKTIEIKCDACGKDLTYTGNCEDYYLSLSVQSKTRRSGPATLMHIEPAIKREHHFCGIRCLKDWVAKES